MKQIAVIGSSNVDVTSFIDRIPVGGETRYMSEFQTAMGGKGANQAVAAAKLGANVLFVTATGEDGFGKMCRDNFAALGIKSEGIFTVEGTTGVAVIVVEENGENRILLNKAANGKLTPEMLDQLEDEIAKSALIILQLEIPLPTIYHAIEMGKKHGIPVLLNPAPAVPDLDIEKVLQCDFFVPNESELSLLVKKEVSTLEEITEAARSLLARGLKHVIVTLGSRGVLHVAEGVEEVVPSVKVKAVDTTGAGDSFIGAFAETWVRTQNIRESLERANRYAAQSVTRKGAQDSYLTAEEFEKV